jgi:hypothetical protein
MNHTEDPLYIAEKDWFEAYLMNFPEALVRWKALDDEVQFIIIVNIIYGDSYEEAINQF